MNAKVGTDNTGREMVMGREGLGTTNENGELFTDFCANNDLVIEGTISSHRDIHRKTSRSPDMATENQIDHIAISRRWRRPLADVRAYKGADIGSDHDLVIAKLRVKIARVKKSGLQRQPMFNTSKLKERPVCQDFTVALSYRIQAFTNLEEATVDDKLDAVKEVFKSTSNEVLGYRKKTHKSWMSEGTISLIDQRRILDTGYYKPRPGQESRPCKRNTERRGRESRTVQEEIKTSR
ncbi:uncharacterized protein LOC127840456 [Dreissena polymorpha]|uniref:uncharacterized protein LOC127840456 n=1 Tax=Dreissena polymorpha TaxID=45954 RepID=UPI002263C8ED|nr:uncharacterized protein LOC127840456 [Dreissena polymorpha]